MTGACDNGQVPVCHPTGLNLRLALICLLIEQAVNASGRTQMVPTALLLAAEEPDYRPSAATIVRFCHLYRLCPRWLLLGEDAEPKTIGGATLSKRQQTGSYYA